MNDIISKVFIIPMFWATRPMSGKNTPTIPQLNPPINPDIILLYSGIVFCAITIFIETESIVTNPVSTKSAKDKAGKTFVSDAKIAVNIKGTIRDI